MPCKRHSNFREMRSVSRSIRNLLKILSERQSYLNFLRQIIENSNVLSMRECERIINLESKMVFKVF